MINLLVVTLLISLIIIVTACTLYFCIKKVVNFCTSKNLDKYIAEIVFLIMMLLSIIIVVFIPTILKGDLL